MKAECFAAVLGLFTLLDAGAVTVRFDDVDRTPADQLSIKGVRITSGLSDNNVHPVATKKGEGLGGARWGSPGGVDRIIYPPGPGQPEELSAAAVSGVLAGEEAESLTITAESGRLTSITLRAGIDGNFPEMLNHFLVLPTVITSADGMTLPIVLHDDGETTIDLQQIFDPFSVFGLDSLRAVDADGDFFSLAGFEWTDGLAPAFVNLQFSVVAVTWSPIPDAGSYAGAAALTCFVLLALKRRRSKGSRPALNR